MTALKFFIEGVKNIRTIGTVSRSSMFVAKTMTKHVDFKNSKCIVELGAGDGPITKYILKDLVGDTRFLTFEVNPKFCEKLRTDFKDDRMQIIEDSAEHLGKYLNDNGFEYADYIVSALPFVSLPEELGTNILKESYKYLKPGGKFIQLNYSLIPKKRYEAIFGKPNVDFVMLNIPPAFIMVCEKPLK